MKKWVIVLLFSLSAVHAAPWGAVIYWLSTATKKINNMNAALGGKLDKGFGDMLAQARDQMKELRDQGRGLERMRNMIQNPQGSFKSMATDVFEYGVNPLDRFRGQRRFIGKIKKNLSDKDIEESLEFTDNGLFEKIKKEDEEGNKIHRSKDFYKKHAVLEFQYMRFQKLLEDTEEYLDQLREEKYKTMEALKTAETQDEVQKYTAKLNAIDIELKEIHAARQQEIEIFKMQRILQKNEEEKLRIAKMEEEKHYDLVGLRKLTEKIKNERNQE